MIEALKSGDHKITRGWLGVQIQPVSADIADTMGLTGLTGTKGALVADFAAKSPALKAGLKAGDVIVKVVNANAQPLETEVDLSGAKNLTGQGTAMVLTSASGADENSLAEPTKVSPKTETVEFSGTSLKRSFPGNSFTVLRLRTK